MSTQPEPFLWICLVHPPGDEARIRAWTQAREQAEHFRLVQDLDMMPLYVSPPSPAATVETARSDGKTIGEFYGDPRAQRPAGNADEVAKIIDPDCARALVTEREWCERWGKDFQSFAAGYIRRWDAALAKANAILALNEPRAVLWCCHARGPDDIYAAPDYDTALAWSDTLNEVNWSKDSKLVIKDPASWDECLIKAAPAPWPYSPEAHAESLPKSIEGFSPALPRPEPRP